MKKNKNGFTLTEVVIVLVLLGVLALILLPAIKHMAMMPDDQNLRYQKAVTTLQEVLNDMISDPNTCQQYRLDTGEKCEHPLWCCFDLDLAAQKAANTDSVYVYNKSTARSLNQEICRRLNTTSDVICTSDILLIRTTNGIQYEFYQEKKLYQGFNTSSTIKIYYNYNDSDAGNISMNITADGVVVPKDETKVPNKLFD